jgi:DNA-directed RNA polymerase specialized sigma24 family protein
MKYMQLPPALAGRRSHRARAARTPGRAICTQVRWRYTLTNRPRLWYHPRAATRSERTGVVSEPSRAELRAIWRRHAQRNDWTLVDDEELFLDLATVELGALAGDQSMPERMRLAVWRAYSTLLYRGLWQREERAAQELWLALMRMALKRGVARPEAEELAQETIARMLEKLPAMRSPQSLLSYALMVFRTAQRERRKQMPNDQPLQSDSDEPAYDPPDPGDLTLEVEQRIISAELQAQLRAKLPNDLERRTLLRIVVFGDQPRDVARDLGLPLHRTRLAKHRAIARLRDDETFIQTLRDLTGDTEPQPDSSGADHDDT